MMNKALYIYFINCFKDLAIENNNKSSLINSVFFNSILNLLNASSIGFNSG